MDFPPIIDTFCLLTSGTALTLAVVGLAVCVLVVRLLTVVFDRLTVRGNRLEDNVDDADEVDCCVAAKVAGGVLVDASLLVTVLREEADVVTVAVKGRFATVVVRLNPDRESTRELPLVNDDDVVGLVRVPSNWNLSVELVTAVVVGLLCVDVNSRDVWSVERLSPLEFDNTLDELASGLIEEDKLELELGPLFVGSLELVVGILDMASFFFFLGCQRFTST